MPLATDNRPVLDILAWIMRQNSSGCSPGAESVRIPACVRVLYVADRNSYEFRSGIDAQRVTPRNPKLMNRSGVECDRQFSEPIALS